MKLSAYINLASLLWIEFILCEDTGLTKEYENTTDIVNLENSNTTESLHEPGTEITDVQNNAENKINRRKPKTIYGLLGFLAGFRFAQGIGPTSYHADRREDAQLTLFSKLFDGALHLSYIKYPYFYPLATFIQPIQYPPVDENTDDVQIPIIYPAEDPIQKQMDEISQQLLVGKLKNDKYLTNFESVPNESENKFSTNIYDTTEDTKASTKSDKKIENTVKNDKGNNFTDLTSAENNSEDMHSDISNNNALKANVSLIKAINTRAEVKDSPNNDMNSNHSVSSTDSSTSTHSPVSSTTSSTTTSSSPTTSSPTTTMSSVSNDNKTMASDHKVSSTSTTQSSNQFYPYPYYHHYSNASKYEDISITEVPTSATHSDFHPHDDYNYNGPEFYHHADVSNFGYSDHHAVETKYHVPFYPYSQYYEPENYGKYYYEDKPKYSKKMEESGFVPLGTLNNKI